MTPRGERPYDEAVSPSVRLLCRAIALLANSSYNVLMMSKEKHFSIWRKAFKESFTLNSILAAAGIAYFALLSFFPLILLVIAIASLWFDPLWVENEIITQLEFIIPGITQLLGENLANVVHARASVTTTASLILLWSGSTLFSIIARVLDTIWSGHDLRPGMRYRGLSLLFVGIMSLTILPLLFLWTTLTTVISSLLPYLPVFLYQYLTPLISVLISILLFGLVYRYIPHTRPNWREAWIGAITCGILWEIAKHAFLYYTANFLSSSNLVYGSVSTIIVFLTWVHLSGLIFFFGAYLSVGYSRSSKETLNADLANN